MRQATRERQARVFTELLDKKHVTVRALATDMAVSEATVRRDLKTLADDQKIHLVHGGAMLPRETYFSFDAKADRNLAAKQQIGRLAAGLVAEGEQVFMDAGTTAFAMAGHLAGKRGLSIVLNSARLALELKAGPGNMGGAGGGMNLIMLGGQYRPERMDTVGPIAMSTLEQLRGYSAFIGADGLSMEFGLSAADIDSAHLHRLAVANAREVILLADHSKFESASLFKIVGWEKIKRLVTDVRPTEEWMGFLRERGIEVIYPELKDTETTENDG